MDKSDRTDWMTRAKAAALRSGSIGAQAFSDCAAGIAAARAARTAYQRGETINTSLSGAYPADLPARTKGTGE